MATNRRVLSISAKRNLTLMPQFLLIQRLFCDKPLNPNPLVAKLLHVPSSRIKTSLDSEQTSALKSFGFSWEALVTSLRSSSPQKAHLVYFFLSFYFTIFFFIFSTLHCLVTEKVWEMKEKWKLEVFIVKWKVNSLLGKFLFLITFTQQPNGALNRNNHVFPPKFLKAKLKEI